MNTEVEAKAVATIVGGPARAETIPLVWPVEYRGKVWTEIVVKRVTSADIKAWTDTPAEARETAAPWIDAPLAVVEALDADDEDRVNDAAVRFIPARFRDAPDSGPTGATGEPTSPASPAP